MRKYLVFVYVAFSSMAFAQFQDDFHEKDKTAFQQEDLKTSSQVATDGTAHSNGESQSSLGVPGPGEHEEGPGNPGEPVPIDGYIPLLLLSGLSLIAFCQRNNKKINI